MRKSSPPAFSTLMDMLRFWADHQPEREALILLEDGERARSVSFRELDENARRVAAYLQRIRATGQRALLLYPTNMEYLSALFGCVYAGVVGVSVVPPRPNRPITHLQTAAESANATIALTTSSMRAGIQQRINRESALGMLDWVETDTLPAAVHPGDWKAPSLCGSDLAYLFYSSGSTGAPKGVMVSHRSVIPASPQELERTNFNHESVFVCTIPLYHAAGLYLFILSLLPGGKVVLMPTEAFLERPFRWLHAVTRYRGTSTCSFAFGLQSAMASIAPEERALLDLHSLRVLMVVGERLQANALERFANTFSPHGFRREAITPGYGLTEVAGLATVPFHSSGFNVFTLQLAALERNEAILLERGDQQGREFVGCGSALPGRPVIIVDPQSLVPLAPGQIGEIWIAANDIAEGYWNRPEDTANTFQARLATGEGPFFRTGDLGVQCGDELVITGRIKDMVILRGKNYYSQDFEQAIQNRHPALTPGGAAAFAIMGDGEEKLAILQEVEGDGPHFDADQVIAGIRKAVADDFGQPVDTVGLVKVGTLPRTPTGKIQRHLCRSMLSDGTLDAIKIAHLEVEAHSQAESDLPRVAPRNAAERVLAGIWQDVLGIDQIGVNDNFFELGGDSVIAIQIVAKANRADLRLVPGHLFKHQTIAELAGVAEPQRGSEPERETIAEGEPQSPPDRSDESITRSEHERKWSQRELEGIAEAIKRSVGDA